MSTLALDGVTPRSRTTDPTTSVDAGRAAHLAASQQAVLDAFLKLNRPIADHEGEALEARVNALTFGGTLSDPAMFAAVAAEPPAAPIPADPPLVKQHGDPSIDPSGLVIPVDADCPHCGWPERTYDTRTRRFGCIRCTYESDERNA